MIILNGCSSHSLSSFISGFLYASCHHHSSSAASNRIYHISQEVNSEEWLQRQLRYLADCERHRSRAASAALRTSLELFHLHPARFIPGTAAGPTNYQAYLLDGITRWNSSRATAAIQSPTETLRTFDARLQEKVSHVKYTHPVISKLNCHICHYR